MAWFKRSKENISTNEPKKDLSDGNWFKCPDCSEMIHKKTIESNFYVCTHCGHHFRIGSEEYFKLLLDENSFKETRL